MIINTDNVNNHFQESSADNLRLRYYMRLNMIPKPSRSEQVMIARQVEQQQQQQLGVKMTSLSSSSSSSLSSSSLLSSLSTSTSASSSSSNPLSPVAEITKHEMYTIPDIAAMGSVSNSKIPCYNLPTLLLQSTSNSTNDNICGLNEEYDNNNNNNNNNWKDSSNDKLKSNFIPPIALKPHDSTPILQRNLKGKQAPSRPQLFPIRTSNPTHCHRSNSRSRRDHPNVRHSNVVSNSNITLNDPTNEHLDSPRSSSSSDNESQSYINNQLPSPLPDKNENKNKNITNNNNNNNNNNNGMKEMSVEAHDDGTVIIHEAYDYDNVLDEHSLTANQINNECENNDFFAHFQNRGRSNSDGEITFNSIIESTSSVPSLENGLSRASTKIKVDFKSSSSSTPTKEIERNDVLTARIERKKRCLLSDSKSVQKRPSGGFIKEITTRINNAPVELGVQPKIKKLELVRAGSMLAPSRPEKNQHSQKVVDNGKKPNHKDKRKLRSSLLRKKSKLLKKKEPIPLNNREGNKKPMLRMHHSCYSDQLIHAVVNPQEISVQKLQKEKKNYISQHETRYDANPRSPLPKVGRVIPCVFKPMSPLMKSNSNFSNAPSKVSTEDTDIDTDGNRDEDTDINIDLALNMEEEEEEEEDEEDDDEDDEDDEEEEEEIPREKPKLKSSQSLYTYGRFNNNDNNEIESLSTGRLTALLARRKQQQSHYMEAQGLTKRTNSINLLCERSPESHTHTSISSSDQWESKQSTTPSAISNRRIFSHPVVTKAGDKLYLSDYYQSLMTSQSPKIPVPTPSNVQRSNSISIPVQNKRYDFDFKSSLQQTNFLDKQRLDAQPAHIEDDELFEMEM